MTMTIAQPLDTTGTRSDTVLEPSYTPDLLGAWARAEGRIHWHYIQSLSTDIVAWLDASRLDVEDRREFRRDLLAALGSSVDEVERVIREWRITADVLRDHDAREILLGQTEADDYVEVKRPA